MAATWARTDSTDRTTWRAKVPRDVPRVEPLAPVGEARLVDRATEDGVVGLADVALRRRPHRDAGLAEPGRRGRPGRPARRSGRATAATGAAAPDQDDDHDQPDERDGDAEVPSTGRGAAGGPGPDG